MFQRYTHTQKKKGYSNKVLEWADRFPIHIHFPLFLGSFKNFLTFEFFQKFLFLNIFKKKFSSF